MHASAHIYSSRRIRHRAALTLIELLIVLLLLALLASALLPSAAYALGRAREQDVRQKLLGSWKLARAAALAVGAPVVWELTQTNRGLLVQLKVPESATLRPPPLLLNDWTAHVSGQDQGLVGCYAVVPPHGVSRSLEFQVRRASSVVEVKLPGVIDDSAAR